MHGREKSIWAQDVEMSQKSDPKLSSALLFFSLWAEHAQITASSGVHECVIY